MNHDKNPKTVINLSIIIPCYNVEDYIEQCLISIIKQDFLPKEILCIDDGATDSTAKIIKVLALNHPCIKYVYQKNQGVSEARNTGLSLASAKYIQFVDPDDILHCDILKKFFICYEKNRDIELFYFEHECFENDKSIDYSYYQHDDYFISFKSGNELFTYLIKKKKYPGACWKYIFMKDILNLNFVGKNHEDHLITLDILTSANLSYYYKTPLYFYRKRDNSLSNKKNINKNYVSLFSQVVIQCSNYLKFKNLSNYTKQQYIKFLRLDYLFNIDIYYLGTQKPTILNAYTHIYTRLFIKNKLKTISNIWYIICYGKKNNVPIKHIMILLQVALNKDINFITNKINAMLE